MFFEVLASEVRQANGKRFQRQVKDRCDEIHEIDHLSKVCWWEFSKKRCQSQSLADTRYADDTELQLDLTICDTRLDGCCGQVL